MGEIRGIENMKIKKKSLTLLILYDNLVVENKIAKQKKIGIITVILSAEIKNIIPIIKNKEIILLYFGFS